MCLGIPGKIIDIYDKEGLPMGMLDFNGVRRETCLTAVSGAKAGDFVLVHAGFALSIINPQDAIETQRLLDEIDSLE